MIQHSSTAVVLSLLLLYRQSQNCGPIHAGNLRHPIPYVRKIIPLVRNFKDHLDSTKNIINVLKFSYVLAVPYKLCYYLNNAATAACAVPTAAPLWCE